MNKIEWERYEPSQKIQPEKQLDEDEDDDEEDIKKLPALMQTPFGLFRVDDTMNPFKQFKFWLGNTNFKLTSKMVKILNRVDGVETLVFLTHYRFIVGVGKLFKDVDVLKSIEKALSGGATTTSKLFSDNEINASVEKLRQDLDKLSVYWSIYVFPNGNIDYMQHKDYDIVQDKYKFYRLAQKYSNGHVLLSYNMKRTLDNEANNKSRI